MVSVEAHAASSMMERSTPKILFVCHNHPALRPGGVETYALDLYQALRDKGDFEPILLARAGPPLSTLPGQSSTTPFIGMNEDPNQLLFYTELAEYDWLRGRPPSKSALVGPFRDFLLAHEPDIVHFQHTLFIGYESVRIVKSTLPDVPIVYTFHEYLPICHRDGQMVRTLRNELCRESSPRRCNECFPDISPQMFFGRKRFIQSHLSFVDLFLTPSQYALDRYVDWGIPPEKIQVEPVACPRVERADESPRTSSRNRFGFFGTFTPYKGIDVLSEAMEMLGEDFDGHLYLYGANKEIQTPEFQERFDAMVESAGPTVTFGGRYERGDLGRLMEQVDWVVVPSIWWETGPFAVLEAFQHGRPVICSDIGGMAEKVRHGESGLHFRRGDSGSLAETMRRAASTPGLWEELRSGIPPVPLIEDRAAAMTGLYKALLEGRPT